MSTHVAVQPSSRPVARSVRRDFVLACALSTLATVAAPALLALSGYLLARAAQAPPILTLTTAIVGVRLFALVRASARYGERVVSHDIAMRLLTTTRVGVYTRLIDAGRTIASTDLLDRLVADTEVLQDRVVRVAVPLVAIVIGSVLAVAIAAAISVPAALVLVAGVVVLAGLLAILEVPRGAARSRSQATARSTLTTELVTTLDGAAELVAWGASDRYAEQVARRGAELDRLVRRDAGRASAGAAATTLMSAAVGVGVLLVAADASQAKVISGPVVAALALMAFGVMEAVGGLSDVFAARREVGVSAERIDAIVGDAQPASRSSEVGAGFLQMVGVRHAFADREVLDNVELDLRPDERVAIMGPSGAGKSLLTLMLLGLAVPDEGSVTFGGVDVALLDDGTRSRTLCWAPQDPYLFPTSIAENVRMARPDADDVQVERALRRVGAGPLIDRLPAHIHARVGEMGTSLSGGERQRVGLARAVLSDAPFVVLDEPASHLPSAEALDALQAVCDAQANRGCLIVTHHDEEAALADRVLVLNGGRLIDRR